MQFWTREEDDMIIRLWAEGLSQSQIAEKINIAYGAGRDRIHVAGRITRLRNAGVTIERRARGFAGRSVGRALPRVTKWGRYVSAGQVPMPRVEIGGKFL